jgi:tocopherol O-methyltransferase
MIACASVTKKSIQNHYDLATPFYRLLWGRHIHHGLWDAEASSGEAQRRLIDRLATAAAIRPGEQVLDVGCGMGGSSIELALRYGCTTTGITVSPLQRIWASVAAGRRGALRKAKFVRGDAESITLPPESFDVVWNVECSEHLFDKPAFFQRAAGWLKPGGRIAVCAWLAGSVPDPEGLVQAVGEGFLCPSFGTAYDYRTWMRDAGLVEREYADLTPQVARTWEICERRVQATGVNLIAWLAGKRIRSFLEHFSTLGKAYATGAMQYGLFVAEKVT